MGDDQIVIDVPLVRRLIEEQFPRWRDLLVQPVKLSGWDNRTFHLGHEMLVRMPSAPEYALQVEKEHKWLPKLASFLPLQIPVPIAIGEAGAGYPWRWSIYRFLEGEPITSISDGDLCKWAGTLAQFLVALQGIDPTGGPAAGLHSFYRGGPLAIYDAETRKAAHVLKEKIDVDAIMKIWETALSTTWDRTPVWVHGDVSAGNLLVKERQLSAVIDFGQLAVGDPACDLAIAWTLFKGDSRKIFRKGLALDANTWTRGRAWALWKALIVVAGFTSVINTESLKCWHSINEVLNDNER